MLTVTYRAASIVCLAIWTAIWLLFLLIRFSPLDIRSFPGAGRLLLPALLLAVTTPLLATALAGVALYRQPQNRSNLLIFACALGAIFAQVLLFLISRWL